MTEENRTYITYLQVTDIPWHRLIAAYGRGTDFPAHLAVLEQMGDLASVKKSLCELTVNMEHQSTLWHATPFGMVSLNPSFYNVSAGSIEQVLEHIDAILSAATEDWNETTNHVALRCSPMIFPLPIGQESNAAEFAIILKMDHDSDTVWPLRICSETCKRSTFWQRSAKQMKF